MAMNRESINDKACYVFMARKKLNQVRTCCKFSMLLSLEIDAFRCKSLGGNDLL